MGSGRDFCEDELNYTGCELSSLTARVQLTGCEEKRLEAMTVRRLAARDLEQVVRTNLERLEPLLFRAQLHQDVRHLIQKQKIKPTQKGEKQNEH